MWRCFKADSDFFSQVVVEADVRQGEEENEESTVSFFLRCLLVLELNLRFL